MPDIDWRTAVRMTGDHAQIAIRLTPKGRRDGIDGVAETVDGRAEIRATVTAVPENGKANKALIKLLAKVWKVPKSGISFISGETDRHKVLVIASVPDDLMLRIERTLDI